MQFIENAPVRTPDNHTAGHVTHVVLDPATKKVTHIVIRQGTIFTESKIVPITLVTASTPDGVNLSVGLDHLSRLPDFEAPSGPDDKLPRPSELSVLSGATGGWLYRYPPAQSRPEDTPDSPAPDDAENTRPNIPQGEIALKEGAHVTTADHRQVGHVESVLIDVNTRRVTNLLVLKGALVKSRKLIPVAWISGVNEDEVQLNVDSGFLRRLPTYR